MSDSEGSSQWTEDDEDEEEDGWKLALKRKMEEELARRVADALPETPPLERLRKRQEAAKRDQEINHEDLNAHLDFSDEFYRKQEQEALAEVKGRLMDIDVWARSKRDGGDEPDTEESPEEEVWRKEVDRQYQFYEPRSHPPANLQHYGVLTSTSLTSFDASSIVPLLPHPKHLNIIPKDPEPLYSPIKFVIGSRTYENQVTQFTHKLRGTGIVYDSQKSPKIQKVEQPSNPLIAPNLVFESRFESGNLRQARRVGQFEYELVLKTDMFTKRHTQWYYFRIENMVPGIIYKFRIVNLLKKDSLYNYGMRPLLYSEETASKENKGWIRHGHHISYGRNIQHLLNPLLNRELAYYELEWQMEFPYSGDTCYLAHCYPFSHTDLKNDLHTLHTSNMSFLKHEVLCESRAGHECYLLTITNFEKALCNKKCIVVSARVHPGESNSSWMMKGLYEFLVSDHPDAKELRDRFVFKVVPMLNPDGVIVGNYRCSLQARDLNRNYRWPGKDRFPTIWHVKNLVEKLQQESGVFVYCDFHGHSRKSNVFMYGNSTTDPSNSDGVGGSIKDFLNERMLPFMIAQLDPEMFNFQASRFAIRKCKEATGRVVMFRQHNILNSFTMEATFSGTKIDQDGARHYNQKDFMDAGALFARGVLQYAKVIEDKEKESLAYLDLAKDITQQLLNNSIKKKLLNTTRGLAGGGEDQDKESGADNSSGAENSPNHPRSKANEFVNGGSAEGEHGEVTESGKLKKRKKPEMSISHAKAAMEKLKRITGKGEDSIQQCFDLLENLSLSANFDSQSDSSDSDSESEPEMKEEKVKKKKKKNNKKKKESSKKAGKNLSQISDEYVLRNFKPAAARPAKPADTSTSAVSASSSKGGQQSAPARKPAQEEDIPVPKLRVLPAIGDNDISPKPSSPKEEAPSMIQHFFHKRKKRSFEILPRRNYSRFTATIKYTNRVQVDDHVTLANIVEHCNSWDESKSRLTMSLGASLDGNDKLPSGWANPYQHRSNGGIPCYSEERSLERAARKMAELQKKVEEKAKRQQHSVPRNNAADYAPEFDLNLQELNALKLEKKRVQDSFNKSIRMLTQSCIPDMGFYTGRLENGNSAFPETDYGYSSSLSRWKHNSLTPINDEYSSPREMWNWYPRESTHTRERSIPDPVKPTRQASRQKRMSQSMVLGTKVSRKQTSGKPTFPSARLGPVSRAPQASKLKNSLKVNPLHYHHGYE